MSEWTDSVVGGRYVGFNDRVYCCTSYESNAGFWMQNVDDESERRCISESAIDRTFHRVKMYYATWRLLALYAELGRAPIEDEVAAIDVVNEIALKHLARNRLVVDGIVTERGWIALEYRERLEHELYLDPWLDRLAEWTV